MAKITFAIPKDYQVPEGVKEGQTFDESVTLKLEGSKICLTAINGTPMPGYEKDAEEGAKAQDTSGGDEFAQRYATAMAAGSAQGTQGQ